MKPNKHQYINVDTILILMKKSDMDDKKLAQTMNEPLSTIQRFLQGGDQRYLHGDFPCKLAKALNTSLDTFFNYKYTPDKK